MGEGFGGVMVWWCSGLAVWLFGALSGLESQVLIGNYIFLIIKFKTMKTFLQIITFLLLLSPILEAQELNWSQTHGLETGLTSCVRIINSELWLGTQSGLYQSSNNGETWQRSDILGYDDHLLDVFQKDDEILMIVKTNKQPNHEFYRSTDNGASWAHHPMWLNSDEHTEIYRANDGKIWILSNYGREARYSEDDGQTWTFTSNLATITEEIVAHDAQSLIKAVGGAQSSTLLSKDYGVTWDTLVHYFSPHAFIEDSLIIIPSEDKQGVELSRDLGASFESKPINNTLYHELEYPIRGTSGNLYVTGWSTFVSSDNGETWQLFGQRPFGIEPFFSPKEMTEINNHLLFCQPSGVYELTNTDFSHKNTGLFAANIKQIKLGANGALMASTYNELSSVFYSEDNGTTWTRITNPTQEHGNKTVNDIEFMGQTAYIATQLNIFKWENDTATNLIEDIFTDLWIDNSIIYATCTAGVIYSSDFGTTWDTLNTPSVGPVSAQGFAIVNGNYLYSSGDSLFFSTDLGATWTSTYKVHFGSFVHIPGTNKVFLYSPSYTWKYSEDNGATWDTYDPIGGWSINFYSNIVGTADALFTVIEDSISTVFVSYDQGDSWDSVTNTNLETNLGTNLAYANGKLYLGTKTSGIWATDASQLVANESVTKFPSLLTVFPNPAKDAVTLNFEQDITGKITISIIDLLGQQLYTRKTKTDGSHLTFELPKLAPNVYFIECRTSSEHFVGKVLVE